MNPATCPNCGNRSDQEGITHCCLEWRLSPVAGESDGKILVQYYASESGDVVERDGIRCENPPSAKPDLEHFYCHRCHWKWFAPSDCAD